MYCYLKCNRHNQYTERRLRAGRNRRYMRPYQPWRRARLKLLVAIYIYALTFILYIYIYIYVLVSNVVTLDVYGECIYEYIYIGARCC